MPMGDVRWYPMTPLSLVESAKVSNSLAFGEAYPEVRILQQLRARFSEVRILKGLR